MTIDDVTSAPPYFSIGLPVYNGESFVRTAVESVLGQTCSDWHLTVIDNQSTDHTWDLLNDAYGRHPQISLLRNSANLGMVGNLNRLLETIVAGAWMTFLPADDSLVLHALDTIKRETVDHERLVLWMHSHLVQGEGVNPNICPVYNARTPFEARKLAEVLYLRGNIFGELSSYFVRRSACRDLRFSGSSQSTDTRFWMQVLLSRPDGEAVYWPDVLIHVHQHPESVSSGNLRAGVNVAELFNVISEASAWGWSRRVLTRQLARSLWCWLRFTGRLSAEYRYAPHRALASLGRAIRNASS